MAGAEVKTDCWMNEYISPYEVMQRGVKKILVHKTTEFQEMFILEAGVFGKSLVLDGKFQSTQLDDFIYHEALVHPAMILHGQPKKALIIGGGEGATLREVLKWKTIEKAVMVDIDGEVVEACKEHMEEFHQGAFDDPRSTFLAADALEYLDEVEEKFDVVISDLCDPLETGPAFQLFTKEFYEKVKGVMAPGGIMCLQAGAINPQDLGIHAKVHRTLTKVFSSVKTIHTFIPTYLSDWGFTLASEHELPGTSHKEKVDAAIENQISGALQFMDGETLHGMFYLPKHVRQAIANEKSFYSKENPPEAFGSGILNERAL